MRTRVGVCISERDWGGGETNIHRRSAFVIIKSIVNRESVKRSVNKVNSEMHHYNSEVLHYHFVDSEVHNGFCCECREKVI